MLLDGQNRIALSHEMRRHACALRSYEHQLVPVFVILIQFDEGQSLLTLRPRTQHPGRLVHALPVPHKPDDILDLAYVHQLQSPRRSLTNCRVQRTFGLVADQQRIHLEVVAGADYCSEVLRVCDLVEVQTETMGF